MRNLLLAFVICMTSSVYAETVNLLQTRIHGASNFSQVSTKFFMNTTTGEGNVIVTVTDTFDRYPRNPGPIGCDRWGRCYPRRNPMPMPRTEILFKETIPVRNLNLVDKRMIYSGRSGNTDCGYLGRSRVLNVPTLYLNGKCKTHGSLRGDNLTVTLTVR